MVESFRAGEVQQVGFMLEENPKLPVSARIAQGARQVLKHVACTLDPVCRGMSPWEPVELAASGGVIDLSVEGLAKLASPDLVRNSGMLDAE